MIKYIGSKRALIPWIRDTIRKIVSLDEELCRLDKAQVRIIEPFAGSCRVGHALKAEGYFVIAGDYLTFSYVLAKALIEADREAYPPEKVVPIIQELNALSGEPGWFTRRYACESRFFQPHNTARIEAIRKAIDTFSDETLRAILMTALIIAADKVDSTTGLQMAYLKEWAPRSYNTLRLEYPPLLHGKGKAILGDALSWVSQTEADIAYIDPPYNQHSYAGNYHIWETLVLFDNPPVYGTAVKRKDVREKRSAFNSRREAPRALTHLIQEIRAKYIVLSFSNEGYFTPEEILRICERRGPTIVLSRSHKRYVGAQIGIYNPRGEKVGKVSHLENREFLFIISPDEMSHKRLTENFHLKGDLIKSPEQASLF